MTSSLAPNNASVFLVDDDLAVRRGVAALLAAADYAVVSFESAEAFLLDLPELELDNAAMLVDVCMPGIQGLELQEQLKAQGVALPVIVMTAHGDVAMAVRAMRSGAVDFLEKPFTADEVSSALTRAFSAELPAAEPNESLASDLRTRFEALTPRETEVYGEIVAGATSKEIARALEISPRTVEVHRQNLMTKMEAGSIAELVRMAVALGICD